jgi:hypothetical protein
MPFFLTLFGQRPSGLLISIGVSRLLLTLWFVYICIVVADPTI